MIILSLKNLLNISCFRPILSSFRNIAKMPKIFVRHIDAENTMKITFIYGNSDLPDRNFTFMRPKEETLETALTRMKNKIQGSVLQKVSRKKKKASDSSEDISLPPLNIMLTKNGEILNTEMKNTDAWISGVQVKVNDRTYEISENPPEVSHISLPKTIMSGFLVYPKITLEFCSKEDSIFRWYKLLSVSTKESLDVKDSIVIKNKSENWEILSDEFFYMATESDIGHKLKVTCIPKCGERIGIEEHAVSPNVVSAGPAKCPFEDRHQYTRDITEAESLRCVSYNILADLYADSDTARNELFSHCPTEALTIDYRKQLFIKEILGYNGDIVCLQEVDQKIFNDDLMLVLPSQGLQGVFNLKGGLVAEGLACFYRSTKFKLLESKVLILSEAIKNEPVLQRIHAKILENEKLASRFMSRTTALQIVLLESLDIPGRRVLIGNTHLYFHPNSDNIRLLQAACCIQYLENIRHKYQKEDFSYSVGTLLMGDFNSCPEFGVYELMTKGFLSKDCKDWKSEPEEVVDGMELSHTMLLSSGCGTPFYTNFTEGFIGCLDYIFYDRSFFKVVNTVPLPTHEQVVEHKALPNIVFPSDHLALVCTLSWK